MSPTRRNLIHRSGPLTRPPGTPSPTGFFGVLLSVVLVAIGLRAADVLTPSDDTTRAAWAASLRLEAAGDAAGALAALGPAAPAYAISLRRGWLSYLAGSMEPSLREYRDALGRAPRSLEARFGLLLPLLALGRHAEAERVARAILRETPEHPVATARLAAALRGRNRLAAAARILMRGLRAHPTDVDLLNELALVRLAQRDFAAARDLFAQVIILDPENAVASGRLSEAQPPAPSGLPVDLAVPGGRGGRLHLAPGPEPRGEANAYFGGLTYDHATFKDHAWAGGINGWVLFDQRHLVEAGVDCLDIVYRQLPDLSQVEATAAYAFFGVPRSKFRLGAHYLTTDDPPTDGGWVVFGGVDWLGGSRWSLGLDGWYTQYPEFGPALDVVQVTPRLSIELARGSDWAVRTDLKGYWIRLGRSLDGLDDRDLFSGEGRLEASWRRWSIAAFGWAGQQSFAVRNNGYTIYNLADEYTSGFGVALERALGSRWTVGLRYQREWFREAFTQAPAAENVFLLTVGWTPSF